MAILFYDNIQVQAGKPVDNKYLNEYNAPYVDNNEVLSKIPVAERHIGLTVNINNSEYWFATGVTNSDLVIKVTSAVDIQNVGTGVGIFSGETITGTNYFRSITGSGSTNVIESGDTIVINTDPGGASLNDDILKYNNTENKYQPYDSFTTGVTFYLGEDDPTGTTKIALNGKLSATEFRLSTGNTSSGTHKPGDMFWDSEDSTLSVQQTENVTQQVGQELMGKGKNITGSLIPNGTVVYFSGSDNGRATISPARGSQNDELEVRHVLGVTTEDIPTGQEGFVTNFGLVRGIDTSSYTEGDIVYLSPLVWGGVTNVKPEYPDFTVEIGIVTTVDAINGKVLVRISDISQTQQIRNIQVVNPPFTANTRSDIISSVGAGTIYMPPVPKLGQQITVIDHDGDANTWNILIDGNGIPINGDVGGVINTNYGSITVVYNGSQWYSTTITP